MLWGEFLLRILQCKGQAKTQYINGRVFDRCAVANELLAKKHYFLKFYERGYLIKKGATGENNITRDLSFSVN